MKWIAILAGAFALAAPDLGAQPARGGAREAWSLLRQKYDANGDGRISRAEYPREEAKFDAFDRNRDGFISREDFAPGAPAAGPRTRPARAATDDRERWIGALLAAAADRDCNGEVSAEEWKTYLASVTAAGQVVDEKALFDSIFRGSSGRGDRLRARLARQACDRDGDGTIEVADLTRVFAELDADGDGTLAGSEFPRRRVPRRLPRRGEPAPDFELSSVDDPQKAIRLSDFAGKKPVALLFGSYT